MTTPEQRNLTERPYFVTISLEMLSGETRTLVVGSDGIASPAIGEAARILASGGLVAFPTEPVYGIGANGADPAVVERLRSLKNRPQEKPFTVHIADKSELARRVQLVPYAGRKLVDKFWPGPLTIVFGPGDCGIPHHGDTESTEKKNSVPPRVPFGLAQGRLRVSVVNLQSGIGVRLPAHKVAVAFIRACGVPVVASSANIAGERPAASAAEVMKIFAGKIDAVLDGGPAPLAQASTVVRVSYKGWELLREGIISESEIARALKTKLLFICTGNSCRSPIAEALCRRILAEHLEVSEHDLAALGFEVASAGTALSPDSVPGRASIGAIAAAGKIGLDLSNHVTQPLTAELLKSADRVYAMSESHVAAVRRLRNSAPRKHGEHREEKCSSSCSPCLRGGGDTLQQDVPIQLLDPDGNEIADPVGSGPEQFALVAEEIRTCLERRVKELCE